MCHLHKQDDAAAHLLLLMALVLLCTTSHVCGTSPTVTTPEEVQRQRDLQAAQTTLHAPCDLQCQALLELAADLSPVPNDVFLLWGNETHACGDARNNQRSWPGITCDSLSGNVVALELAGKNLTGRLSPAVAQLPSLQRLSLANNSLHGPLMPAWSNLSYLEELDLSANMLTGNLPSSWSLLGALQQLNASHNALDGSLPVTWSALTMLEVVDLSHNALSSSLPDSWGRLAFLSTLVLRSNRLQGPLPSGWARQESLLQLNLADNNITGIMPPEWATGMSSLRMANISNNSLAGSLPETWSNMTRLQTLSAQANLLTGKIPPAWSRLTGLDTLNISDNNAICGGVPLAFTDALKGLSATDINSDCTWEADEAALLAFKGSLAAYLAGGALDTWQPASNPCGSPAWEGIGCQDGRVVRVALQQQLLSGNQLQPLLQLSHLQELQLSDNHLQGTWPDLMANATAPLTRVDLSHNRIDGQVWSPWPSVLQGLTQLDLSANKLTGPLPSNLTNFTSLSVLNLRANHLSGTLPATLVPSAPGLAQLQLGYNPRLGGTLPAAWGASSSLRVLGLQAADLERNIPLAWSNMQQLAALNVQDNPKMCGVLPPLRLAVVLSVDGTMLGRSCANEAGITPGMLGAIVGLTMSSTEQGALTPKLDGVLAGVAIASCCLLLLAAYVIHLGFRRHTVSIRPPPAPADAVDHLSLLPPSPDVDVAACQVTTSTSSMAKAASDAAAGEWSPMTSAPPSPACCAPAEPPKPAAHPGYDSVDTPDGQLQPTLSSSPADLTPRLATLRQEDARSMSPLGMQAATAPDSPRSQPELAHAT